MLSVLIVNWNTREPLRACLASLRACPATGAMETIVVDNASTDGSADMVRAEFPEAILIASGVNTGYARGNNLAFAVAKGDRLLTLNPDTEALPGTLDRALDALDRHPRAGAVAVRLVGADGETQRSVRGFPTALNVLGDVLRVGDAYRLRGFDYEREGPAPQPMGTFLLFRREALAAVGDPLRPFDEAFPIFFNEVDLLKRMADAGWPTLYTPRASVLHHGGESTKQVRKAMVWESHRSLVRYLRKHRGTGAQGLALPLVALAVHGAALVRARGFHEGFVPPLPSGGEGPGARGPEESR